MNKLFFPAVILVAVILSSQAAFAQTKVNFTHIANYQVPDVIGKLIGDARVNIYDYENRALGSIVIFNGTISETANSLLEKPTHQMLVKDAATLQRIFDADSFTKEFNRQRSLHNIRLEALDFLGQIKLAIGTLIVSIVSLFISPG